MPSNLRSLRRKWRSGPWPLAVEVALEVEQVRLEQRVVGVLVERRAAAEVDGARVDAAVGPLVPAGVDAVGRQAERVRHLDVGGREAEQPAALVARRRRCRAPRAAGRACVAASSTSPPASARRMAVLLIGSSIAVGARRRGGPGRRRSRRRAPNSLEQRARCPRGGWPKWKSSPTTTTFTASALDQHPLDERLGRLLGLRLVEAAARPWRRRRSAASSSSRCSGR